MLNAPQIIPGEIDIGGKKFSRKANERVMFVLNEHNKYRDATANDRKREFENLRFLAGIEDGQFPDEIDLEKMRSEGRHVGTYNLSYRKVAGISGSITRNPFDAKYLGEDPSLDYLTQALQQAYLSDYELMDWESEYLNFVMYGLTYQGVMELMVSTQTPASPLGNIDLKCHLPGTVTKDPDYRGANMKGLRSLYREAYMTASRMKEVFKAKSEDITREIKLLDLFGREFEDNQKIDWNKDAPSRVGSQFLVVEKHYLKAETVQREFDPVTGTIFWEWMKDDEKVALANELGVVPERIRTKDVTVQKYKRIVVVPDIPNLVLFDGEDTRQIGRLPFFIWSATRINGKSIGIIDFLKDAQKQVNFRQATITLGAQGAVNTGAQFDPAAFGNDETLIRSFKEGYGDPRQLVRLKPNASRTHPDAIKALDRVHIAPELFNIVDRMTDMMDYLAPQPAAGEARTERSGESGIHFVVNDG